MVLVDSSVWISYFKNHKLPQVQTLNDLLEENQVLMCELVMMEVLRGMSDQQEFNKVKALFLDMQQVVVSSPQKWIESIDWYRSIRKKGYTIRSQVDILLAMFCYENGIQLLHNDYDFDTINQFYPFLS